MRSAQLKDEVTVRCPFCDSLFLMARPLFTSERERTACPECRAVAKRNTEEMRRKAKQIHSNAPVPDDFRTF